MDKLHTGVFGKTLVAGLREQGYAPSAIAGNSGIDLGALDEESPKIPFVSLAGLFERAAELTGDDLIGHNHALVSDYRELGLIAFTGVSSPTVRSLLHTLARYQRINSDAVIVDVSRLDTDGVLEWHYDVPRSVVRRQFIEFNATGLVGVLRNRTGQAIHPEEVAFRHFRKSNLETLRAFFGRGPDLGDAENRLRFRQADLDLKLKSSDHRLNRVLTKFSDEALEKLAAPKRTLSNEIEEVLARHVWGQDVVARALGMSVRTLSRRLADMGTNFKAVREGYRASVARAMLRDSEFQITEIAFVLGYNDVSTFSAAFKRWVGQSPSEYRKAGVSSGMGPV